MIFIFFVLGAICASFAGVVAGRLHTNQSIFSGRSFCDYCGRVLHPTVLIPIISYIVSRGRASCCHARIPIICPLSEFALGILFALAYLKVGFEPALPFLLFALTVVLALVLYDLAHHILPSQLLWLFVATSVICAYLLAPFSSLYLITIARATIISLFFFFIFFFSHGRMMGFADAPFAFGLSMLAGQASFSGFVLSFWIGAVIGIIILFRRPRGSRMGVEVPFAPFLAAGFLLAYFTEWNIFTFISRFVG